MKEQEMKNESSKINLVFLSGGPGLSSLSFMPLKKLESSFNLHFLEIKLKIFTPCPLKKR